MSGIKAVTNQERTMVTLMPQGDIEFDAEGLEELIRSLALLRAQMNPSVSTNIQSDTKLSILEPIQWAVGLDDNSPRAILFYILHPGFGWMRLHLSPEKARGLAQAFCDNVDLLPTIQ